MPYYVHDVFDTAAANQPASLITGEAVGSKGFVRNAREKRDGYRFTRCQRRCEFPIAHLEWLRTIVFCEYCLSQSLTVLS